jgi:serine O-acetyltransferase
MTTDSLKDTISLDESASSCTRLRADTVRQCGAYSHAKLARAFLTSRTFRPIVTLRLCQAAVETRGPSRLFLPIWKILHAAACHLAGMDLPWQTKIAGGLLIAHGWGLVVNPNAVVGRNVSLLHGVTLGRSDRIADDGSRESGFPVLEDEVWVGPHAIIVGAVTIGHGSRIAGGAFVTEDVPPHSLVIGNPATIRKSGIVPDVHNPA